MADNIISKRSYSEEKTRKAYSKVFRFYNIWSRLFESKTSAKVIQMAQVKNGEAILEAAVGTGAVFEKIADLNKNGVNEGIDLSPEMLSRAERRLKSFQHKNYCLQVGSVYYLPYEANTFDLIINNYMFDLLPEEDYHKILKEFYRVLKNRGRAVVSTMTFGRKWYNKLWIKIAEWFPSLMTQCRPIHLADYIFKAGFRIDSIKQMSQNTFPSEIIIAVKKSK
jgi:ubiquinone/menaquinone biosynthesis C-methylase UbiE